MNLLFFSPHTAIWAHSVPEAYLARALADCGHTVQYLSCGKAQTYCAPMTAHRLAPGCTASDSARVCADCTAGAKAIASAYHFSVDALSQYLNDEDFSKFDAIAVIAIAEKSLDTEYLGVKVGRVALYEFTLAHKKMSIDLTEVQWAEYRIYLTNALRTLQAFSRYITNNRPDVIFTFSPQYSNIHSCICYAIDLGVKVMFIENGTNLAHRLGTMRVWDWNVHKLVNPALIYWDRSNLNPVSEASAAKVSDHFEILLAGQHFAVFSPPVARSCDIRQRWSIQREQKLLLMTLSSYDEAYSAMLIDGFPPSKVFSDVFRTQAEWVKATLEWVSTRPDLFLVIRVHPRDFPNKRESVRSEQSYMLEGLIKNVPINVHVNWPAEGISLYDLLEDTQVLLTGWSVTAIEALVLGIPVVTYDANLPSYPRDIHYTGRSEAEYYTNIDRALADGWQFENVINGFRWMAYNFVSCTVTVSETFGGFELSPLSRFWWRVKRRLPMLRHTLDLRGWQDALPGARIVSEMMERGNDALPPTRKALSLLPSALDERRIILKSLSHLHNLLYTDSKLPKDKSGLSQSIRTQLACEDM